MEKIYVNAEQYEAVAEAYREKSGYDDMSEEEKQAFDERLDQVLGVSEEEEEPDQPELVLRRTR